MKGEEKNRQNNSYILYFTVGHSARYRPGGQILQQYCISNIFMYCMVVYECHNTFV